MPITSDMVLMILWQNLSPSAQLNKITVLVNVEFLHKEVPITSDNGPYDFVAESRKFQLQQTMVLMILWQNLSPSK
jgi:hypothetical protein